MSDKPTDRAAAIRTWLMKAPRPASLSVESTDGKEYDVKLKQGAPWSETAISVAALNPSRIEALADDGKLLRAVVVDTLVEKGEAEQARASASFQAMQSTDPETQRMICFATLLEHAHDRATEAIRSTTGEGFAMLREICDSLAQQAASGQQAADALTLSLRNLLVQQAQDALDAAEDAKASAPQSEGLTLEGIAQKFMSGQQAAEAEKGAPAPAAKPNGKH